LAWRNNIADGWARQTTAKIAVTLSIANHHAGLPIAYRLYLPESWANDAERGEEAHVPEEVEFRTNLQIALAQIEEPP
jgi:SRSO17 transposase